MKLLILSAVVLLSSVSAFAVSNSQIAKVVLDSNEVTQLEQSLGPLSNISISKKTDATSAQVFELQLTFTANTPIGVRSCFVRSEILSIKSTTSQAGSSQLSEPVFDSPICQK